MNLPRKAYARAVDLSRSRRVRIIAIVIVAVFVIFSLAGFVGVPFLVRYEARTRIAADLHRPVKVGPVSFNPYTLSLNIKNIHVGMRGAPQYSFADIARLHISASWKSLFHLAPIITRLEVEQPYLRLIRTGPNTFNFSDLLTGPSSGKKSRFSISNITLTNGKIVFNDKVVNQRHRIEQINLGIPFIANLPAYVDIYVRPLLQMVIDGSPLRITGTALPFKKPSESTIDLRLSRFDLTRYAEYLSKLPIRLLKGTLSCDLIVHFVSAAAGPLITITGNLALDRLDLRDRSNAELLSLNQVRVAISNLQPLRNVAELGAVTIDGLDARIALNRDGTTNLTPLTGGRSSGASAARSKGPFNFSVKSFDLSNAIISMVDNRGVKPIALGLRSINFSLKNFATAGTTPASFNLNGAMNTGGSMTAKGDLNWTQSKIAAAISFNQVDLPALQQILHSIIAADVSSGKLNAKARLVTQYAANHFNVHIEPADISLDDVSMKAPGQSEKPLQWKQLNVLVEQVDLAARTATVKRIRVTGLNVSARREHDGAINLAALVGAPAAQSTHPAARPTAPSTPAPVIANARGHASNTKIRAVRKQREAEIARIPTQKSTPGPTSSAPPGALRAQQQFNPAKPAVAVKPWKYSISSIVIDGAKVMARDEAAPQPAEVTLAPLNIHLTNVTSNFAKPFDVAINGVVNEKGHFKTTGSATLKPISAHLRIAASRVDLTVITPYLPKRLNAKIARAYLTINGAVDARPAGRRLEVRYRGDATLANVRTLDKVTSQKFVQWKRLSARRLDALYGAGEPEVRVGELELADFYARIILNSDGHLNLSDIMGKRKAAPVSLTEAQTRAPQPQTSPTPSPELSNARRRRMPGPGIDIGGIILRNGRVNWTDNFIKPNYIANLTDISGKIGKFGVHSTAPADVSLAAKINRAAPLTINGSSNPLAPMAYLNISGKANGVELTQFTPYSAKYTGYPITKGTLSVNVEYLLENGKLSAQNHIFLDQLTFGPRVTGHSVLNVPIRLAVALLKNSKGEIHLDVPVSGSLSDPEFSFAGVFVSALKAIIVKAVSSPFKLLAGVVGTKNGEQLSRIDFNPGLAKLTPEAQSKVANLAEALKAKPSLQLTITGRVNPAVDRPGLREAKLNRVVKLQKAESENENPANVKVSPGEYDKYLKSAYKAAKFEKPRNFLGMVKSIPPEEMKKLLLAHITVTDDDLLKLAKARADTVRAALAKEVEPDRLFVAAPELESAKAGGEEATPSVALSLQ